MLVCVWEVEMGGADRPSPIRRILSAGSKGKGVFSAPGFGFCAFFRWEPGWAACLMPWAFLGLGAVRGFWRSFRLLLRPIAHGTCTYFGLVGLPRKQAAHPNFHPVLAGEHAALCSRERAEPVTQQGDRSPPPSLLYGGRHHK